MSTLQIVLIIIAALLAGGLIFSFFYLRSIARRVYEGTLVRTSPEKWGRCCSDTTNEEQVMMWERGLAWAEAHKDTRCELEIENEGFHLFGEYFDLGYDRAVIIIPGRSESLMYSYYFAPPYEKAHCNVLVIDIRAHGRSSGTYDYIGVGEDRDVIKWATLLHEKFGVETVLLHGICMGAATGVLIYSDPRHPDFLRGQVSEGMYISFYESYKQHMIYEHHPVFPVLQMVMHLIKKHTGTDVSKIKPIDRIDRVKVPFLFLCGMEDKFSLPERSRQLFDKCGSDRKEIVWFEGGAHSHLRINDEEGFDRAIADFIQKNYQENA